MNAPPAPRPGAAPGALNPVAAAPDSGVEWADLVARLAQHLDRGGREWTAARRKSSLQRVLESSRSDPPRLLQRLQGLVKAWEGDRPAEGGRPLTAAAAGGEAALPAPRVGSDVVPDSPPETAPDTAADPTSDRAPDRAPWSPVVQAWQQTLALALQPAAGPPPEAEAAELAARLAALAAALAEQGATPALAEAVAAACARARVLLGQRHHLLDELTALARALAGGLVDLAEDDSWARGQCEALQARLAEPPTARGARAAATLLGDARRQQQRLRAERRAAQEALKTLIGRMLSEVGDLGDHTGRFQQAMTQHAQAVAAADSLGGLANVVRQILDDSRAVQAAVHDSRQRLQGDRDAAEAMRTRVLALEAELRRLAEEVATDPLTQVANRRGLQAAFETLAAQAQRAGMAPGAASNPPGLAVALLDIDNFKKLNDTLGHAAGDQALKSLAAAVKQRLRPGDQLARFGGEEFVVLMPATDVESARQALTRLQRGLTEALFLHEGRDVFVTFSAGVTPWRPGEALEATLERADLGLYEAKRTGKNRCCAA